MTSKHPPRILWANAYCLLDTSSGASMSARQMLLQLLKVGFEVQILGATVFDHQRGATGLQGHLEKLRAHPGKFVQLRDGQLTHTLLITASTERNQMTCAEESQWFSAYEKKLETFKPDVVFYYGGRPLDFLIAAEARFRKMAVVFYLVNGNYSTMRWCRDVDLILTDSQATAGMYKEQFGIDVTAVGAFIDPQPVVAPLHSRKHLLFVNPSLAKGAAIVAMLALMLEQRRPDIRFEVVESRGDWRGVVRFVTGACGTAREALDNVLVTPNTTDMRPLYGRARLLLAPSLWWESGARVLAEAMLNGIPAIITDRGGSPEMVGDGGIRIRLNDALHQKPYMLIPDAKALLPLVQTIEAMYDNAPLYASLVQKAKQVGLERHAIDVNTRRLAHALLPLVDQSARQPLPQDPKAGVPARGRPAVVRKHGL